MAVFGGKKSSNDIINNDTISGDEVVASYVPPRYLFLVCLCASVFSFVRVPVCPNVGSVALEGKIAENGSSSLGTFPTRQKSHSLLSPKPFAFYGNNFFYF